MLQIVFINRQPRMLGTVTGRRLLPGKNKFKVVEEPKAVDDMSEAEYLLITQNDQFRSWLRLNWVVMSKIGGEPKVVVEPEVLLPQEDALKDKNINEAADLIVACNDPELLAVWHERDTRKGIHKAIEDRLDVLDSLQSDSEDESEG